MLAKINSGATVGLDSVPVTVEVDVTQRGLPAFNMVGSQWEDLNLKRA